MKTRVAAVADYFHAVKVIVVPDENHFQPMKVLFYRVKLAYINRKLFSTLTTLGYINRKFLSLLTMLGFINRKGISHGERGGICVKKLMMQTKKTGCESPDPQPVMEHINDFY